MTAPAHIPIPSLGLARKSAIRPGQSQSGFGLTDALGGMLILLAIWKGFIPLLAYMFVTPQINQTARQMEAVRAATQRYVQANYASLASSLPLNGAASPVSTAMLKNSGQLSPHIPDTNPYGQNYSVRIRYVTQGTGANQRNVLEPMALTTGGQTIPDDELYRIAAQVRDGGVIASVDPNNATGTQGGWGPVALAGFGGTPGAGHLAVGMFYSDAGGAGQEFLYRNAVPSMPEVNRMNTAIDMNGNPIENATTITATNRIEGRFLRASATVTEGEACGNDASGAPIASGTLASSAAGSVLSCQSGVWSNMTKVGPVHTVGPFREYRGTIDLGERNFCALTWFRSDDEDDPGECRLYNSGRHWFLYVRTQWWTWCGASCF